MSCFLLITKEGMMSIKKSSKHDISQHFHSQTKSSCAVPEIARSPTQGEFLANHPLLLFGISQF